MHLQKVASDNTNGESYGNFHGYNVQSLLLALSLSSSSSSMSIFIRLNFLW